MIEMFAIISEILSQILKRSQSCCPGAITGTCLVLQSLEFRHVLSGAVSRLRNPGIKGQFSVISTC